MSGLGFNGQTWCYPGPHRALQVHAERYLTRRESSWLEEAVKAEDAWPSGATAQLARHPVLLHELAELTPMSIRTSVVLTCDSCKDQSYQGWGTATETRKDAKQAGWAHRKGRDICVTCQLGQR